jgi:hypothetical protein
MPDILTRIKMICPVRLAIKWPGVITNVSRSGGYSGEHGRPVQLPQAGDGCATIAGPFVTGEPSTDRALFITPDTRVRAT